MIRFSLPEGQSTEEQIRSLRKQARDFLSSEALLELYDLLDTDAEHFSDAYDQRKQAQGRVKEVQEIRECRDLEPLREPLYPLLKELGFFTITEPLRGSADSILVPGAAYGSCFLRTEKAASLVTETTLAFTGLSCFRPINPAERKGSKTACDAETEFGVMTRAFQKYLKLGCDFEDEFHGDRNLNRISCIRTFSTEHEAFPCRIFAAPSSAPDQRRADTADTFLYYLREARPKENTSFLAVTDNIYCNRQLLQFAYILLKENIPAGLDVIGCHVYGPETPKTYRISFFLQEVSALKNWCEIIVRDFG